MDNWYWYGDSQGFESIENHESPDFASRDKFGDPRDCHGPFKLFSEAKKYALAAYIYDKEAAVESVREIRALRKNQT